jgi:ATP diphosphatase
MARLRDPQGGCPWDLEQNFATIAPYTIEEAYEVADAIDRGDLDDLCDELGDLLLQVVFHARMAEEQGAFAFAEVARAISDKMQRRHPHVFADVSVDDADGVMRNWDAIKRAERAAKGEQDTSALAGISRGLPEWQRAVKLQSRAAKVGFDWPGPLPVLDKAAEELQELREEFERGDIAGNKARLQEELGDLLFVCANLARHADIDLGAALRGANHKFERRFRAMEAQADAQGERWPHWTWMRRKRCGSTPRQRRKREDARPVPADRAGRDRRLLPAVVVAAQGRQRLAAAAGGGQPGPVRLAADPAPDRQWPGLCRLRWRVHRHRAVLVVAGRRHPPQPLGPVRRSPVPGRHGGDHVRAAHRCSAEPCSRGAAPADRRAGALQAWLRRLEGA